jgi:hypothetical protein
MTNNDFEFIIAFLNKDTWKNFNIITIYKPPRMWILSFSFVSEKMLIDIPLNCPTIIIGGFNENILKTLKSTMLENFTNKYKFQLPFSRCISIYNT